MNKNKTNDEKYNITFRFKEDNPYKLMSSEGGHTSSSGIKTFVILGAPPDLANYLICKQLLDFFQERMVTMF